MLDRCRLSIRNRGKMAGLADESCSEECRICLGNYPGSQVISLLCSHRICEECMCSYLEELLKNAMLVPEKLVCPLPGCHTALQEDAIFSRLDPQFIDILQRVRLVRTMESVKNEDQKVL